MNPSHSIPTDEQLLRHLQELFGFDAFRPLQREAVHAALDGNDVLLVMPTGAGKSLCFQLPAALEEGVTIVVSPLIALMRDQVLALRQRPQFRQLGCAFLNSSQGADEQREVLQQLRAGMLMLLYVAPERFRSSTFTEALGTVKVSRFVVDEAHCISEWGHDFRPDYLSLRTCIETAGRPPVMAVTATATRRVQQSIVVNLGLHEPVILSGGFNRPNLHFAVHRCKNEGERQEKLARALPKLAAMGGSGLIYVATRKQCEEVAALASNALRAHGVKVGYYHAGINPEGRSAVQQMWLSGEMQILVATNAFGMGIDKEDVRFVVHYIYPDSLESYYQEAGRAGRDGRRSRCVILHHFADRRTREWFIDNDALSAADVQHLHEQICARGKQEYQTVPREWWRQTTGWLELKLRLALGELSRYELLRVLGETADETMIQVLRRDFPTSLRGKIKNDLLQRRDERMWRLDQIGNYCKTNACRRLEILDYFGDEERPAVNGSCCDNCDGAPHTRRPTVAVPTGAKATMPSAVQADDPHSVLQALDAMRPRLGKSRLNRVLRGSTAKDVQQFQKNNPLIFGLLRGCSEDRVEKWLEELISAGYLQQADEEEFSVCFVTPLGRNAWQQKSPVEISMPHAARPVQERGEVDEATFQALRGWRRKLALQDNLPPYCILSDRTLEALAVERPQAMEELREVVGIGDAKLQKYGADLLRLLAEEAPPVEAAPPSPVVKTVPPQPRRRGDDPDLPATVLDTLRLLRDGLDIEGVAEQRALKPATVWTHIEKLMAGNALPPPVIDTLIPPELFLQVETALRETPPASGYRTVWELLGGEIDYGIIRCVAAGTGLWPQPEPVEV